MNRTSNSLVGAVFLLAVVAGLSACRKEPAELPPQTAFDERGLPKGDPPFTPAEIHRERSREADTSAVPPPTVPAKSEAPPASPAPAAVPAPPPPPPPAPAAKAAGPAKEPAAAKPVPAPSVSTSAGDVVPNQTGEWVLQVNVHRSQPEAQAQVDKLGREGIPAYAVAVQTGEEHLSGNYWRVRVGRFSSRADAQKYGTSVLEPKGMKFWVDRKSNESKQGN